MTTDKFIDHLREYHSTEVYECHICSQKQRLEALKAHLNCHNISDYHCLHCRYSGNNLERILHHSIDQHPHMLLFIAARFNRSDALEEEVSLPL